MLSTHVTHSGVTVGHGADHVWAEVPVVLRRGVTLGGGEGGHGEIGQVLVKTDPWTQIIVEIKVKKGAVKSPSDDEVQPAVTQSCLSWIGAAARQSGLTRLLKLRPSWISTRARSEVTRCWPCLDSG